MKHLNIKDAMDIYFQKLNYIYVQTFNTCPSVSWSPDINQDLFITSPDEDGDAQWCPISAQSLKLPGLCDELNQFYSSYYYCSLNGRYQNIQMYFDPIDSLETAQRKAKQAILDGDYYLKNQNAVLLATCSLEGNDELLLFYKQETGELILYDQNKRFMCSLECSFVQLVSQMEALI